jgi:transcriptional regulator GlxA family with amidase domain
VAVAISPCPDYNARCLSNAVLGGGDANCPTVSANSIRTVEVFAFPAVHLLDATGPLQVFAAVNDLAELERQSPPYAARLIAMAGGTVTSSAGVGLVAEASPAAGSPVDALVVPGGPGVHEASREAALVEWLRAHARDARRVASVCSGAFLLAAAGLLDGKRAATHWRWCAELARRYPAVHVESDPIFVQEGDVWTSAGVTAGIDLALALVEHDLGRPVALAVARHLVVFFKRPGGQAQFSEALALRDTGAPFDRLHAWMARNLHRDLSTAALAGEAHMSERSFRRHYQAATGSTPARMVERLRVEAARHALSDTALPIKRIAVRYGFGTEETMRRSFIRLIDVSPQAYREASGVISAMISRLAAFTAASRSSGGLPRDRSRTDLP